MSESEPESSGLGQRSIGSGASASAPTAPHATPPSRGAARTGPSRFWSNRRNRVAFAVGLALSVAVHGGIVPLDLLPQAFVVRDVEGEASIAVDLVSATESEPAPPPPPPPEEPPPGEPAPAALQEAPIASVPPRPRPDAGPAGDAAAPSADADVAGSDASLDASFYAGRGDGAGTTPDDGGSDAGGGADASEVIADSLEKAPNLVTIVLNADAIRTNPVGASLGALLRGIPQWNDFMNGTDIDPVRDTNWMQISGPSLVNTGQDVVLIRYAAADAAVDRAIATVSRRYEHGGAFDTGVPGVKGTLAHADRAERVLLRSAPHVLAVVAPSEARRIARQLSLMRLKSRLTNGNAFFMRFVSPHRAVPELPDSITELRLRVVSRVDGGADAYAEGDTADEDAAAQAAADVKRVIARRNTFAVSLLTHGLLDQASVAAEGSRVTAHLPASLDQLETLAGFVAAFLGVELPDLPGAPSAAPAPSPSATPAPARRRH